MEDLVRQTDAATKRNRGGHGTRQKMVICAPDAAQVGAKLPFPAAPQELGCLPEEIVLEVFGCAGVSRLVEGEARSRGKTAAKAGSITIPAGDWRRVLRMTLKETEISRLCVAKGLEPST